VGAGINLFYKTTAVVSCGVRVMGLTPAKSAATSRTPNLYIHAAAYETLMNKEALTLRVIEILTRAGFTLSDRCNIRPRSFDLAARRCGILLLLRTLSNIDGLSIETAREMRRLSGFLDGSPLVIGSKSRDQTLEDGVTYFRYGIPSINPNTLHDCFVEGVPPLVHAAPGGLYIHIDSERLKSIRTSRNISLGELATELGISRRTISKYEDGGTDASIDVVLHLEEILDAELVCPIKILSTGHDRTEQDRTSEQPEQNEVSLLLTPLGFFVFPAKQAPFKAISNDSKNTVLTGISTYNRTMVRNARLMSSISSVAGTESMYIVKGRCRHTQIDGTVLIKESEFERIDDPDDVMRLIQERNVDKGDII